MVSTGDLPPVKGPGFSVVARGAGDSHLKLTAIVEHSFGTQIAGQTEGSQAPKRYHLSCFLYLYPRPYGHDDARQWYNSLTEAFMKELARRHVPRPSKRCGTAGPLSTTHTNTVLDHHEAPAGPRVHRLTVQRARVAGLVPRPQRRC